MNKEKLFYLITYGCQMNFHDSEKMAGQLINAGYKETNDLQQADIIIFNTCCVREKAEEKVRGKMGEIKKLKDNNPSILVGIGGCMPQQEGVGKKLLRQFPFLNFVFGPHTLDVLPALIEESNEKQVLSLKKDKGDVPILPVKRKSSFRAWIPIIKGCENFCTYCIVPYVRGKEISRPMQEIIEEVIQTVKEGIKEVVLLGQNVNAYGRDRGEYSFPLLLKEINKISGLARIRYMTSHPRDFSYNLVDVIAKLDKVCEHFHLPMQAGSSKILKKMNRGYTQEEYIELIKYIRKKIPHSSITTDFIVGFPGEEDEDFFQTIKVVEEFQFDSAFMFIYSSREGTPAAKMADSVPQDKKKERHNKLMNLQQQISLEKNRRLIGKDVEILSEGSSKKESELIMGRTRTNKPVVLSGFLPPGNLACVTIKGANSHTLFAELTETP